MQLRFSEAIKLIIIPVALFAEELTVMLPGDVPLVLTKIKSGTFKMGSRDSLNSEWTSVSWGNVDKPVHDINFEYEFYLGKYEVTQAQWEAVMGYNNCRIKKADHPVETVSWTDARYFIEQLNKPGTVTNPPKGYFRLPTESEWEYAARAGTETRFHFGNAGQCIPQPNATTNMDSKYDCRELSLYAWWGFNNVGNPQPVGKKLPNQWGLYDMYGNVYEWCEDDWIYPYNNNSYGNRPINGASWISNTTPMNSMKMTRGSWRGYYSCNRFTSSFRTGHEFDFRHSSTGFRLAFDSDNTARPLAEAPSQVSIRKTDTRTVTLQWDRVSGASFYRIYRSLSVIGYAELTAFIFISKDTVFQDTSVDLSRKWDYTIFAVKDGMEGKPSTCITTDQIGSATRLRPGFKENSIQSACSTRIKRFNLLGKTCNGSSESSQNGVFINVYYSPSGSILSIKKLYTSTEK